MGTKLIQSIQKKISGIKDEKLWELVKFEKRIFITLDLDFSDIRKYKITDTSGIILLRPKMKDPKGIVQLINKLLRNYKLKNLLGKLVAVDKTKIRIRENLK